MEWVVGLELGNTGGCVGTERICVKLLIDAPAIVDNEELE